MPRTKTSDVAVKMVGQAVRKTRRDLSLTQAEVARRLGVNPSYVTNVEAGRVNLTIGQMAAFAEAMDAGLAVDFPRLSSAVILDRSAVSLAVSQTSKPRPQRGPRATGS